MYTKKTIKILELTLLLLILYFTWGRFDGKLSSPFYLKITTARILLNIGITAAVTLRVTQLTRMIRTKKISSPTLQLLTLGLYLMMIALDLYSFIKWNLYAEMYFHISVILLTPILLGGISMTFEKVKNKNPSKSIHNAG